ncbi:MAG: hypothetical protein K2J32_13580, partial [Ruminococcus sp.]|nr:hypothetical protein [Ruminococcus sp.]
MTYQGKVIDLSGKVIDLSGKIIDLLGKVIDLSLKKRRYIATKNRPNQVYNQDFKIKKRSSQIK